MTIYNRQQFQHDLLSTGQFRPYTEASQWLQFGDWDIWVWLDSDPARHWNHYAKVGYGTQSVPSVQACRYAGIIVSTAEEALAAAVSLLLEGKAKRYDPGSMK